MAARCGAIDQSHLANNYRQIRPTQPTSMHFTTESRFGNGNELLRMNRTASFGLRTRDAIASFTAACDLRNSNIMQRLTKTFYQMIKWKNIYHYITRVCSFVFNHEATRRVETASAARLFCISCGCCYAKWLRSTQMGRMPSHQMPIRYCSFILLKSGR